jgi:hypothetical protein
LLLRKHYRQQFVGEAQQAEKLLASRRKERDDFRNSWASTMVMRDAEKPKDTFLLVRGQYNNRGEKVGDGCAGTAAPVERGVSEQPAGIGEVASGPGASADGAGGGEPVLAGILARGS